MEWVGTVCVVALLLVGLVAAGVRVPGDGLVRSVFARMLCAVSLADRCGDEPGLIAAYGTEVGEMVRRHMPTLVFERGARALPVDFRRCRESRCADGGEGGEVNRSDAGLAVTAFVHVVDCREGEAAPAEAEGADCSGPRAGNLYLQYWTYYVDSATLRDVPVAGEKGFHLDDWESVQVRIGPDGRVDARASSHHGYNHGLNALNWSSDAGLEPVRDVTEALGGRLENGWGPETRMLLVSGGSHAGNVGGIPDADHFTPGGQVHLIPLEPIAASDRSTFAVTPPWRKRVWRDPEASGTD